jgi:ABC-type dipeptide/oligopeptide/nickel transport system ATPase subunit
MHPFSVLDMSVQAKPVNILQASIFLGEYASIRMAHGLRNCQELGRNGFTNNLY